MYIPKHNKMNSDDEIFSFIEANNFGILVTQNNSKLTGTHIPILLNRKEGKLGTLYCHIAKANKQSENISGEALVIFSGVHKYISSGWYESDQSVPTWNYFAVHAYGELYVIEDRDQKVKIITELVEYFEPDKNNYSLDNLKTEYFEKLLKGITVFKIEITSLEGKEKLSQNHSAERQNLVIEKLYENGDDDSIIIADKMKKNLNSEKSPDKDLQNIP